MRDPAVLAAIGRVPRERFVSASLAESAFDDAPLPIGGGQTISQPAMVALMAEAARIDSGDRVLEVGTGSGYGAAVLAVLAARVVTVERLPALAERARTTLRELQYDNVTVAVGDGTLGRPGGAPFNAIVVTAAGPAPPEPLLEQLADGGRLVIPIGSRGGSQHLMRLTRTAAHDTRPASPVGKDGHTSESRPRHGSRLAASPSDRTGYTSESRPRHGSRLAASPSDRTGYTSERLTAVRFVPLIGAHGFTE